MLDGSMSSFLAEEEPQAHAGNPGIRLVVRPEHGCERLGLEHRAVLVAAAAQQRCDVASHVSRGRVDGGGARRGGLTVDDRRETAGAKRVSGGPARPDPLGADDVAALHAEGPEDVLSQIAVEGLSGHVLDDLAERGEPVVSVHPLAARLDLDPQASPVVLSERRHGTPDLHPPAERRPKQIREPPQGGYPGGVSQEVSQRHRPKVAFAGTRR